MGFFAIVPNFPCCYARSARFPPAQAESGRQSNISIIRDKGVATSLSLLLQEGFVHSSTFGIASPGAVPPPPLGSGAAVAAGNRAKGPRARVPLVSENKVRRILYFFIRDTRKLH